MLFVFPDKLCRSGIINGWHKHTLITCHVFHHEALRYLWFPERCPYGFFSWPLYRSWHYLVGSKVPSLASRKVYGCVFFEVALLCLKITPTIRLYLKSCATLYPVFAADHSTIGYPIIRCLSPGSQVFVHVNPECPNRIHGCLRGIIGYYRL